MLMNNEMILFRDVKKDSQDQSNSGTSIIYSYYRQLPRIVIYKLLAASPLPLGALPQEVLSN